MNMKYYVCLQVFENKVFVEWDKVPPIPTIDCNCSEKYWNWVIAASSGVAGSRMPAAGDISIMLLVVSVGGGTKCL